MTQPYRHRRARAAAAGATLVAVLLGAATAAAQHAIPIAGDGRQLVVHATLNRAVSGPMLVDTGASYCVLTRATARRLGLGDRHRVSVPIVTANGEVDAALVHLDSMELADVRLGGVDSVIMDAVRPPLIGIIGLSFLRNFRYSVDHGERTLTLER